MYDKLPDDQLVHEIITKDKDLYRFIVDRYQAKLMRYVRYLVTDEAKALDVVQETFIRAYINLRSYHPNHKFSSWIYRIAHNQSMNQLKKYRRETPFLPDVDFASSEDLQEDFTQKEIVAIANSCLAKLPPEYAEPLSLFYLENLSYQEISDILRLPTSTIGTRIRRAKKIMKSLCRQKI